MIETHLGAWKLHRLGGHGSADEGVNLGELVGLLAGEPFGAPPPKTVCPVILAFAEGLNGELHDDALRADVLAPLAPDIVGTARSPAVTRRRAFMCADFTARAVAPIALETLGRTHDAARLRGLRPVVDTRSAIDACLALRASTCRDAAHVLQDAAQVPSPLRRVASSSACLLSEVASDVRHWRDAADLVRAMCAVVSGDGARAEEDDAPVPWQQQLAFLSLADDEALVACSTPAALETYWAACSDPSVLLRLYSRTGDRRGLVLAACACARAAVGVAAAAVDERRVEGMIANAEKAARGELDAAERRAAVSAVCDLDSGDDDVAAAATASAIAAVLALDSPERAWMGAKDAAEAFAWARCDVDADEPTEKFRALRAEAMSQLAHVVRAQLSCPTRLLR